MPATVLLVLGALLAGCTGDTAFVHAPARNVAYNPFVPASSVRYDNRGTSGVAYRGEGAPRRVLWRRSYTEGKEVVTVQRPVRYSY